MAISAVCGALSAPTSVAAAGDEPAAARLIKLSGITAKELAAFGYAEPVLVAYTEEGWAAVVFSENPDDIPDLLKKLIVPEVQGPGCVPEGAVSCCDDTGVWVLNTEFGWLRVGERCEEPPHDDGVEVVRVPQALTQQLYECCGIIDEYMDLAKPGGTDRVLWNLPPITPSTSGDLSLPPRMLEGSKAPLTSLVAFAGTAETRAPMILAHDHPPSNCDDNEPDSCRQRRNKVCHDDEEHWYKRIRTGGSPEWCRREPCRCPRDED